MFHEKSACAEGRENGTKRRNVTLSAIAADRCIFWATVCGSVGSMRMHSSQCKMQNWEERRDFRGSLTNSLMPVFIG